MAPTLLSFISPLPRAHPDSIPHSILPSTPNVSLYTLKLPPRSQDVADGFTQTQNPIRKIAKRPTRINLLFWPRIHTVAVGVAGLPQIKTFIGGDERNSENG